MLNRVTNRGEDQAVLASHMDKIAEDFVRRNKKEFP